MTPSVPPAASTSARRTTVAGATALTTAVLPIFLVGALGGAIRDELGISETAIGALVTVMFVSAAVTATAAGHLTERIGAGVALRTGVGIAGLGAAIVGVLARGWWQLAVPLAVVGFAVALIDTGAARAFADRVPVARQGFAFGIKEASIPGASMLAGLSLPSVAALLGWRASFLAATGIALLVLVLLPAPRSLVAEDEPELIDRGPLPRVASAGVIRFSAGVGMGTGAATAAATFLVPSITVTGASASLAGTVLAIASLASIGTRIGVGRWADTEGAAPVPLISGMLLLGGACAVVMAMGLALPVVVVAAIGVLGAGWGWTGLAFLAVVRANPRAPAAAAGVVLTGLGSGSALGPLAFGAIVDAGSYPLAWTAAVVALLVGSGLVASAHRALAPIPV